MSSEDVRALIDEARTWATAIAPEERLKGEWYTLRLADALEASAVSSPSDPCGLCGHAREHHYKNDGCYGCLDKHAPYVHPDPHEFAAVSTPPTITNDEAELIGNLISFYEANSPSAQDPDVRPLLDRIRRLAGETDPYAECVCGHGRHTHVAYTGACGLCDDCPAVRPGGES